MEFKDFEIIQNYFSESLKFTLERPIVEEDENGYRIVKCRISTDLGEAQFNEYLDWNYGYPIISNELMDQWEYEEISELFDIEVLDDTDGPKSMIIAHVLSEVISTIMQYGWDDIKEPTTIQL